MSGPFDLISLAASIAANLATNILLFHTNSFRDTKLGGGLSKIGLIEPSQSAKLQPILTSSIIAYLDRNTNLASQKLVSLFSEKVFAEGMAKHLVAGETMEKGEIIVRMADELDLPRNLAPEMWPHGINPNHLIDDFLQSLEAGLGTEATLGELWLGLKIRSIKSPIEEFSSQLSEMQAKMPSLFSQAEGIRQREEWTSLEKHYAEHLCKRFIRLGTPGARELHGVNQDLSVAYISLNVKIEIGAEPQAAEQFLLENPLLTVRGPAGSGKTTLLSWIVWSCAGENQTTWSGGVPFFIPLRTVARTEKGAPVVSKFLSYSVDTTLWTGPSGEEWVDNVLRVQKRGVVMIDGVDELPPARREGFWHWVQRFTEEYPGNRIIITSRTLPGTIGSDNPQKKEQWSPPPGFIDAHLEPMSNDDIAQFIDHWHNSVNASKLETSEIAALNKAREDLPIKLEDPANRRIRDLCSTPLLCAMVCVLHWREEGYLPRQRVDLYARCCDMLIEARDLKRGIEPPTGPIAAMTKNDKELILQRLAFDMMNASADSDDSDETTYRIEIPRSKATEWIGIRIPGFQSVEARSAEPNQVLDYLIERSGLLREPSTDLIDFPHRSFQEYLAACAAGAEGQEDFLAKQADDDQWHETIMLAAGTTTGGVNFGRRLIEALIKRGRRHQSARPKSQRVRKTCFALALGCLENLRQHDPDLRDEVLANLNELVPPRNDADARIVAVAGDAAVSYLEYSKWKDERTATVSACAQALRLIGTAKAERALIQGYCQDLRDAVLSEICRLGRIPFVRMPVIAEFVTKHGRLPPYARMRNVELLYGLQGLKEIDVSAPPPRNIGSLGQLNGLESVNWGGLPAKMIGELTWPDSLRKLGFFLDEGGLEWLSRLDSLDELRINAPEGNLDIDLDSFLPSLKTLTAAVRSRKSTAVTVSGGSLLSLTLRGWGSVNLANLRAPSCLQKLDILYCALRDLLDIGPMNDLESLKLRSRIPVRGASVITNLKKLNTLVIENISDIVSANIFSQLPLLEELELSIADQLLEFNFDGENSRLRHLKIQSCSQLSKISIPNSTPKLENLELNYLPSLTEVEPSLSLQSLKKLEVSNCQRLENFDWINSLNQLEILSLKNLRNIQNLNFLSSDMKSISHLTLWKLPKLHNIDATSNLNTLTSVSIVECPNIESVAFLSKLPMLRSVTFSGTPIYESVNELANSETLENIYIDLSEINNIKISSSLRSKVKPVRRWANLRHGYFRAAPEMSFVVEEIINLEIDDNLSIAFTPAD